MLVISNGMLRSGSTLQYNLAACVLEIAGPLQRVGFLGNFDKPEVRSKLEALKASDKWAILKTHEAPLERAFYDERVRVLFSYRDVRDIAASISKKWGYPFEKILADIDAMIEIERRFGDIPNVLVQSYELLYENLPGAIREIAAFLDVACIEADVTRVASMNSIEASKARIEQRRGNLVLQALGRVAGRFRVDPKTQMHDDHVSASGGRDGDWRNQFEAAELDELQRRFGKWLAQRGYGAGAQALKGGR